MSTRFRSLLPALALSALAIVVAAAVAFASLTTGGAEPAAAAPTNGAQPKRRAAKRPAPAPSVGERAAHLALKAVGVPYRWGGASPSSGFDCSGLVRWAYGRIGIELPHNSYALFQEGRAVARSRLKPGDVLFFEGLGHVGLYLGRGRMVHAPRSGRSVEVVRLAGPSGGRLAGARRVVPA